MTVKPITARRRLELSQLSPAAIQREGMGTDIDFAKFLIYLTGKVQTDLNGRVTAASINRTIEGASTLSVTINDWDRALLRSGLLSNKIDVQIDGLWFRLASVDKSGDELTLTFEDREIAILRTYNKWKIVERGVMTRAEFVLSLLREVKEYKYQLGKTAVIPELHKIQPIEKYAGDIVGIDQTLNKAVGISTDINNLTPKDKFNHRDRVLDTSAAQLTAKGAVADKTQIQMANIILAVGDTMGVSRRVKVIAIMTAITESVLRNNPGGDDAHGGGPDDSAGLFQQYSGWGTYIERTDPETSARLFYNRAIVVDRQNPNQPYWYIAAEIQHPREDLRTQYAKWRTEAERFVNAQGDVGSSVSAANAMKLNLNTFSEDGPFYYYRGLIVDKRGKKIRKPENSWDCFQRLADDVDWRAFLIAGVFYWISEDDLFKQLPLATITEFSQGVNAIDGSYDTGKKSATLTLRVEVGRWKIPPGSVVYLKDLGPWNGRWLVNDFSRDLIGSNREASVTLKKPRPELPEPKASNAADLGTGAGWLPQTPSYVPPTKDLITQVLTNTNIHFSNPLETSDIKFSQIDDRVLQMLMFIASKGYDITVTALRSDHSNLTSEGNVSAHSVGKAVDIGIVSGIACGNNDTTLKMMQFLTLYQVQLGFTQLIGPFPSECLPLNWYDAPTLKQHRNHIHVGWPIN